MRFLSQAQGTVSIMASEGRSVDDARGERTCPARVLVGGGIGAGKSSVVGVFAARGFRTIVADDVGRSILGAGEPAVSLVADRWPGVVEGGVVDRAALARIVFSDAHALEALESITHPAIAASITRELADHPTHDVCVETPVIGAFEDLASHRVAVVAPPGVRIARAIARGGDPGDVRARVASQPDDAAWESWADFVVDNDGPWAATERSVDAYIDDITSP